MTEELQRGHAEFTPANAEWCFNKILEILEDNRRLEEKVSKLTKKLDTAMEMLTDKQLIKLESEN